MRTEHIAAPTWREAIKLAPWAASLIPVEGGYMAFADDDQATEFRKLREAQRAMVKKLDTEREDCLQYLSAEFGDTLTIDQIRFAITIWMERGRRARVTPIRSLGGREALKTFDQLVADGEGRN